MGRGGAGVGLAMLRRLVRDALTEKLTHEETPEGGEGVKLAHLRDEDHSRQRVLQVQRP